MWLTKLSGKKIEKFENWLRVQGCEIVPPTNEYERIRFKGAKTGVLYKSGKTSGGYTDEAISCYLNARQWNGGVKSRKRSGSYARKRLRLLERDGDKCFYCNKPMNNDITVEHLIDLKRGGSNKLENLVLAHEQCNNEVSRMMLSEKIKYAVDKQVKTKIDDHEFRQRKESA